MAPSALEHIASKAIDADFWVLSDEIYSRLVYDFTRAKHYGHPGDGKSHHHL